MQVAANLSVAPSGVRDVALGSTESRIGADGTALLAALPIAAALSADVARDTS